MTHKMHLTSQVSRTVSVRTRNYFIGSSMFKVLLSDMPLEGIYAGKDVAPLLGSDFFVRLPTEGTKQCPLQRLLDVHNRFICPKVTLQWLFGALHLTDSGTILPPV